jgi:hypothetical protein
MGIPRQLTEEEVRNNFIKHLIRLAAYWEKVEGKTCLEKIEGAIFSTLVTLDGEADDLPSFIVAPYSDPSDKNFYKDEGKNWYPQNNNKVVCDISGKLHDTFAKMKKG